MALLELTLLASTAYAGAKLYQSRRKKLLLVNVLSKSALERPRDEMQALLTQWDEKLQAFVQTNIDPLLHGVTRQQQSALLTAGEDKFPLSETEKSVNRRMAAAACVAGTAALAQWLFPPLLLVSIAAALYAFGYIYTRAIRSLIRKRRVSIDLLSAIYFTGIFLTGYYIFVGIALMLYLLGYKVMSQMENSSRRELGNIFGQQARFAWCLVDGVETQIPTEQLQAGDIIVVHAGEPLPVDGVIVQGMTAVDQHVLTGEAQPIEKSIGDPVFAATLMLTGSAHVQVQKAGAETNAAQISKILAQTTAHQTELASKGLEIANKSALPTLLLAGLACPIVGFPGAVALLASAFGYNMRNVSLLGMINYLQIASRRAILVKDGRALERLHEVDTFVFDKTGTLTLEQPHVAQIYSCQAHLTQEEILTFAAAAEYRQPHPIAKAIMTAAETRNLQLPPIDGASYEVGYGIKVFINNQLIRVGSSRFMQLEGIAIPASMQTLQAACQQKGHSMVMVAVDDNLIGALELHATLRPEAESIIADLRQRGLHVAIISGDQEAPTRELAKLLGIDTYFANTLPENKASLIAQLQSEGRVVCFIGDGINDAIALQQADVSISLLGATTIATDTAQIVLMAQSLAQLGELLDLAANFDKTLRQGFWTSMVPGVICIGGVFFLHFGIIAAELLYQLGFFTGLGVAMKPLFDEHKTQQLAYSVDGNHSPLASP
ncbi:MAG: heavy metal translocating P-type ATPase [Caldilineaceae bacterium]